MKSRRGRRRLLPLICAAVLAYLPPSHALASATPAPSPSRPRIGLALSGGGARGIAHVGVLQVLEEHRIPVDFIAGSSMGAVVGGLYASGLSPAELDSAISAIDWMEAFADRIPRRDRSFRRKRDDDLYLVKHKPGLREGRLRFPPGMLDGQRIDLLLKRLSLPMVTVRDFDSLAVPYRAVAADIVTGEAVVLDHGDLALAMRSSMSIPAVFAPREIDGRLLVDGGVTNNFPIDQVRRMGADVVIAVDIATPPQKREDLESVFQIALQVAMMTSDRNKELQIASLGPGDVFIRPDLGKITVASFDRADEAIPIGREAAHAALPSLERLAVSEEEYRAYQSRRAARVAAAGVPTLDAVQLVNRSRLDDAVLTSRLDASSGAPLDVARLEKSLDQLYGLELFESVAYDVAPGPRGHELTVTARERAWGPNYLQGGVAVFDDFEGPNFNAALAYSRTAINRRNGEWRTGVQVGQEPGAWTELYQPVDRGLRWFVDLELSAIERAWNVFDGNGHKLSELGIRQYGGALAIGREMGTWGEVRTGIVREGGRIRVQVGDPDAPSTHFDKGEAFAQLFVDRLDEVAFPHHGATLRVRGSAGLDALGSTVEYEQALVEGSLAATRRRTTALIGGLFGTTRDSDAPLESRFRLGGLGRLSGLEQDELVGQHAALLRFMVFRPVLSLGPLAVNAGLSAEYGNVFQSRSDIALDHGIAAGSAFVGADTPLGPLCIAYGRAERGRDNYYLTLGQPLGGRRPGFRSQ
ncbi:MAG: patatin-like phospholipase family protein [Bacteroidota bacterium]